MPRNGSGVYSLPAGSTVANGDVSDATDLNTPLADIESDANTPRPVVAGGTGASSASAALVNLGLTATAAEINVLDGVTATTAELNILDGVTATTAEINALDGVTATGTALIVAADAAAGRTAISAQAADATLTSLSGLSLVAGDVLYATGADTLVRLGAGTAGQVLTMNSGATAPEWATPATTTWTEVATGTLSGATVDVTGLGAYSEIMLVVIGSSVSVSGSRTLRVGTSGGGVLSTSIYRSAGGGANTNLSMTDSSANARSWTCLITNFKDALRKGVIVSGSALTDSASAAINTADALDRIQIGTSDTYTGGTYYVYGR